jgi:hypothetical protein
VPLCEKHIRRLPKLSPRAVDLARPFLAAGPPVCIGGFHVSGCIAMLPEMPQEAANGLVD